MDFIDVVANVLALDHKRGFYDVYWKITKVVIAVLK